MKSIMGMYTWLDIATDGIRFGPDREEVRLELRQHIEDRAMDLARIFPDMEEREVHKRALEEMGDPWELKRELGRVHRPWLGYVWRCTQGILWGILALILLTMLDTRCGALRDLGNAAAEAREACTVGRALYGTGTPDWEGEQLAVYDADAAARLGRSTVSVTRAARWREPEGECVYLRLRITWDRPWERSVMAGNYLWAEDDLGNTYQGIRGRAFCTGWRWSQRDLALENVPAGAKELHIRSALRDGLDLTVDLTKEAVP